jgi:two-component sensor histidine kinase
MIHRNLLIWAVFLLAGVPQFTHAQQPNAYILQQHRLLWADSVYREAVKKKDSLLLAEAYYLYGKTYEAAMDLLTTQKWYLKSLAILEPRGYSYNLARIYGRLAANEIHMNHYAESHHYLMQALAVAKKVNSDLAMTVITGYAVTLYATDWSQGGKAPGLPRPNPDSAAYYRKMNLEFAKKISKTDRLAKLELLLASGQDLWYQKKDTAALSYFRKAREMAIQNNEPTWEFRIMREMSAVYLDMDQPQEAWKIIKEAEVFLDKSFFKDGTNDRFLLETCFRDYFVKTGDWRRAYEYGERLHKLERNSYISDRDGAVTRLNLEYETEKKEARLRSQQRELGLNAQRLRMQRQFLIALGVLLFIVSGVSVALYRIYRKNQRMSLWNAELVREQNHRVKNNLQLVSSLLSLQSNRLTDEQARQAVEESQSRVETMAILHRHLYDGEGLITVDMKEFIPQVIKGVIQSYGFRSVKVEYSITPFSLPANQSLSIGLILNELVTNACKYAFPETVDPTLWVSCFRNKKKIVLEVSDNGPGMDTRLLDMRTISDSFGLKLIRIQVEQLYGTCQFKNEGGTSFQMQFNL